MLAADFPRTLNSLPGAILNFCRISGKSARPYFPSLIKSATFSPIIRAVALVLARVR